MKATRKQLQKQTEQELAAVIIVVAIEVATVGIVLGWERNSQ